MASLEEVNTDDGKCSAHEDALTDGIPAVQKMTQEPINPDDVVDFGAAVQAATSAKTHRVKRRFKTQCERAKPTVAFGPLAMPTARPKERCLCDSSTDTRSVHDVSHVRGSARSLPRTI